MRAVISAAWAESAAEGMPLASEFFLIPSSDPSSALDLRALSRGQRIGAIRDSVSALGKAIAGRLEGWEVQYLEGVGGWTARGGQAIERSEMESLLHDLPVDVAPNETFYAI